MLAMPLLGCAGPQRVDYVSSSRLSISDQSEQADQVWEAIQETLRRHRFRLDRVDRRAGVITTVPEMSQHFFEIWRKDVATRHDLWEATINPVRRWVEVRVSGDQEESWGRLAVAVHKQRLSSPDRQFNSTGAAYQYFGNSLPSTTGLGRVTPEHDCWLDLGRDAAMEDYLLERILYRAGMPLEPIPKGVARVFNP
jgi:hypothetical protein